MTEFDQRDDMLVIRFRAARLDAEEAPSFKAAIEERVQGQPSRAILDASELEFLDSTGLGAIVSLLKRMGPSGALAIVGAQPAVKRLLQITQLDRVFRMFDTVQDAEAALRG